MPGSDRGLLKMAVFSFIILFLFIISQGRNNHKHNGKKTNREEYEIHVHDEKKVNVTKC